MGGVITKSKMGIFEIKIKKDGNEGSLQQMKESLVDSTQLR